MELERLHPLRNEEEEEEGGETEKEGGARVNLETLLPSSNSEEEEREKEGDRTRVNPETRHPLSNEEKDEGRETEKEGGETSPAVDGDGGGGGGEGSGLTRRVTPNPEETRVNPLTPPEGAVGVMPEGSISAGGGPEGVARKAAVLQCEELRLRANALFKVIFT